MANQDLNTQEREESQSGVNSGGMVAFLVSLAVTFGCFIYVVFLSGGVDLKEVAPVDSSAAAQQVLAEAEVDVSGITEPWLENEDMVKHGKKVFKAACVSCHGTEGKGDGIAGTALNPKPRNLVEGKWKKGGSSLELFNTLQVGIAGGSMQGYKDSLSAKDRWALVQYIRSITENKVADNASELTSKAPALN